MKLNTKTYGTAQRSRFVAPTLGGAKGGVCPQAGIRRVDGHAWSFAQVSFPTVGADGAAMGDRTWSPLIS